MTAAPFVVPGLTLADVLEAIKRPEGKRLYDTLVRTARELTELAAQGQAAAQGAAPPTAPAPPPANWSTATSRAAGEKNRAAIVAALDDAGDWVAPRDIAQALGLARVTSALGRGLGILLREGAIEHNGGQRTAARYRTARRPASNGAAPPPISRRVQRELEAERRATERRAAAVPATNGSGTLIGQALHALIMRPATIPELAARLDIDRADAARVIRRLEDDGDLERRGRRRGEILYQGRP